MKKCIRTTSIILLLVFGLFLYPCFCQNALAGFLDVPENEWFAESVAYVKNKGLMNGVSASAFEPKSSITRGMIVTIIYRVDGLPEVKGTLSFSDVKKAYYRDPIIWASANGIVNGYSNKKFGPDDAITREQFAAILYRYSEKKGLNVSTAAQNGNLSRFKDAGKISEYAKNAMLWANEKGLIKGVSENTLDPQGKATRAQAATIFVRFDQLLEQAGNQERPAGELENPEQEEFVPKNEEKGDQGKADRDENAGEWDDVNGDRMPTKPSILVESITAKSGGMVEVDIKLQNNPGILGMLVSFEYDEETMRLAEVRNGNLFSQNRGYTFMSPKNKSSGCRASWYTLADEGTEADGIFVTLCFVISEKASSGEYSVCVSCDTKDIVSNVQKLELEIENGKIYVAG